MNEERRRLRGLAAGDLIKEARAADAAVGAEVTRLHQQDPQFKAALDRALLVEDEQIRRKTGR